MNMIMKINSIFPSVKLQKQIDEAKKFNIEFNFKKFIKTMFTVQEFHNRKWIKVMTILKTENENQKNLNKILKLLLHH